MKIFFIYLFTLFYTILYYANLTFSLSCCCDILQSEYGFIEANNRKIFTLVYPDSFDICLISKIGDADLYISNENPNPSYNPESYILHSATCGEDILHIHKKLKRPIYVSVFGYPSYKTTHFFLNIVSRESTEKDTLDLELLSSENKSSIFQTHWVKYKKKLNSVSDKDFTVNDRSSFLRDLYKSSEKYFTYKNQNQRNKKPEETNFEYFFKEFVKFLKIFIENF